MVPSAVQDFRREYRERHISPRYSGMLHLAFTSLGSLAVVAPALQQVRDLLAVELLTVPLTFLFANHVEYRGHKGPMHRSTRGLALLFERHTEQHHRFFTDEAMSYEGRRDYKMVLFPPVRLLFFLGAIAAPVGGAFFLVASRKRIGGCFFGFPASGPGGDPWETVFWSGGGVRGTGAAN